MFGTKISIRSGALAYEQGEPNIAPGISGVFDVSAHRYGRDGDVAILSDDDGDDVAVVCPHGDGWLVAPVVGLVDEGGLPWRGGDAEPCSTQWRWAAIEAVPS